MRYQWFLSSELQRWSPSYYCIYAKTSWWLLSLMSSEFFPWKLWHSSCFKRETSSKTKQKAMIAHSIDNKFDDSHGNSCRLARGLSSQHSNGLAARARTGSWLGCVLPMAQHHSPQVKWLIASTNELDLPKLFFEGCDIGWLLTTLWVLGGAIWNQGWWHHVVFSY